MPPTPIVHLELHTADLPAARGLYAELCGWRPDEVETRHGTYVSMAMGGGFGGGIVQCPARRPLWLPYVEVEDLGETLERARRCGAAVLLDRTEGPHGWRSIVATEAGGEIAFWQRKR